MDYDDNDFQSQNLHLACEESSKLTPVLKPYALPKFEFDDTLQEHLRFDSLVETEVFLGIESNEDNQWIEDFSRANSEIEFSSSAAESCSIVRRNNVWSEATSSESVEMLLKSVGQEEIIPVQATFKESDVVDELGILAEQMEPNLKLDDNISSIIEDATDLQPALLEDETPGIISQLKDDAGQKWHGVEDSSQTYECETSTGRIVSDQDPNAVSANLGLPSTEGTLSTDGKCKNVNESNINSLIGEFQENRMPEHASTLEMAVENVITSMHNIITTCGDSRNQELGHVINDISDQKGSSLQAENGEVIELSVPDKSESESGVSNMDDPPVLAENAGNSSISNVVEQYSMIMKGGSHLPIVEGCNNAECSEELVKGDKYENVVLSSGKEVENQPDITMQNVSQVASEDDGIEHQVKVTALETSPVFFKDDGKFEEHATELGSSSTASCASLLEPKMGSLVHAHGFSSLARGKDELLVSGCEVGCPDAVSNSEASLLSTEENKLSKGECDGNSELHVGGDSSTLTEAHTSAELHQEAHETETVTCTNIASGVRYEAVNDEHQGSSSTLVGALQICEEKIMPMKVDVQNSNLEVADHSLDKKEFLSDSLVGKKDESPSSGVITDDKVSALNLHMDAPIMNNSDVTVENSNNTVCMEMDIVPASSQNVVTSDGNQNQVELSPPVSGSTPLDEKEDDKEETANMRFTETSEIRLHSMSVKEQLLSETGDLSNAERQDELQTAVGNEVSQECSKEMEAPPVLVTSTENKADAVETGNMNVKENYGRQDELQTAVGNEVSQECSKELEAPPVFVTSTENKADAVETGNVNVKENYEKDTLKDSGCKLIREDKIVAQSEPLSLEETCSDVDQKGSAEKEATIGYGDRVSEKIVVSNTEGDGGNRHTDSDKPACGSPTVISAVQPSQSEKKEVAKGSGKDNVPVSETIEDAIKIQPLCQDSKGNDASKSDASFTFEVSPLAHSSKKESGKSSQFFPTISSANVSMIVEGSPSIPVISQRKPKVTPNLSHGSPRTSGKETVGGSAKGTTVRKPRQASPKGSGKRTSKKGSLTEEGTPTRKSRKGDKSSVVSPAPSGTVQLIPSSTASLPDLNGSAPPTSVFQQPFTDLQQVQLRAQIFVYGSLIQGVAPDEAYMISAFGGHDGGRNTWESAWRTTLERSCSQKSPSIYPETPLPQRSVKQSGGHSKCMSTPTARASSMGTPSNTVNPMMPISSPLWGVSTPSDALQSIVMPRGPVMDYQPTLSPLHPYQTPPVSFASHNTWLSQPPFRGPWVASAQPSAVDTSARFPLLPNMEPFQLTPVKEQSGTHSTGIMHVSPVPVALSGAPIGVFAGTAPQLDAKKVTMSLGQHSADPKPRKRKKVSNSEDPTQKVFPFQSQPEPSSSPTIAHLTGSFTTISPVGLAPKSITEKVNMHVSPISSIDHLKIGVKNPGPRAAIFSEENLMKVKETKLHAEEAAALAASAVSHSQELWAQLNEQKCSGLVSDVEVKVASAAVAIAAAASVAKAAAAAAKVAHDAALEAKTMADEALSSTSIPVPFKGDDGTNSSTSIIVAAKEAARRRVEDASAASKRAENLDAIVKAAELAAEAVSQAGKIVCMGDPVPLKQLVECGQLGYWKAAQASPDPVVKLKNVDGEQLNKDHAREDVNVSVERVDEPSADIETLTKNPEKPTTPREISTESKEDRVRLVDGFASSITASEKKSRRQKGRKASDMSKATGIVPESETGSLSETISQSSRDTSIKEGSQVEVFKNDERFKAAWYPANVLSLKNGKAYVGYKELISAEGPVKEWVALEGEGSESPIIRLARPMTAVQFEGTRKRRRVDMGDYCWSIGDKVDALIQDSWWEGVITTKNNDDKTSLTVHFPAQNVTSTVRAWHLRPSLSWKDGEWIEWSNSVTKDSTSHEVGDTPKEKRLKMTTTMMEIKDNDETSKSTDEEPKKTEEPRLLPGLSANDKVFNIGKNSRAENRLGTLRKPWTGLHKEESGAVLGVPKPGKKRKFMDVSKHFVGDQARKRDESAKISKYLMPQESGTRPWRNNSKTDPKPKAVKYVKPQSVSSRTIRKNDPSNTGSASDNLAQIRDENEISAEGSILYPLAISKKASTSDAKSERASKGKLAPASGRLPKIDDGKGVNSVPENVEPRRSVRRIQPTSRLLEGLQSSLIVSKIPSISHDRSQKNKSSRGNSNG